MIKIIYTPNPNKASFNRHTKLLYIDPSLKNDYFDELALFFFIQICEICVKEKL